ncbi:hypothetical protein GN956_G7685 [Arapaima gigas]
MTDYIRAELGGTDLDQATPTKNVHETRSSIPVEETQQREAAEIGRESRVGVPHGSPWDAGFGTGSPRCEMGTRCTLLAR